MINPRISKWKIQLTTQFHNNNLISDIKKTNIPKMEKDIDQNEVHETIALLEAFSEEAYTSEQTKNLVLLIGVTGVGKSTIGRYLSGGHNLTTENQFGNVVINGPGISKKMTNSMTLLPELLKVDSQPFYLADCPGFADTRSSSKDIAATIFTQKLLRIAGSVKFGLVVLYSDAMCLAGRVGMSEALKHVKVFLDDVSKFKDHIILIVNKVPQDDEISDDNKKANIVGRLKFEFGEDNLLLNILADVENIKFLHAAKLGDINADPLLVQDRQDILEHFALNMTYFDAKTHKFGLSIREETKLYLYRVYDQIYDNINKEIIVVGQALTKILSTHDQTKFFNIVSVIDNLNLALPRTNLLANLNKHNFNDISAGLQKNVDFLVLMEQLPPYLKNQTIVGSVETFNTTIVSQLQLCANSLHESEQVQLIKCIEGELNRFQEASSKAIKGKNENMITTLHKNLDLKKKALAFDFMQNTVESFLKLLLENVDDGQTQKCISLERELKKITDTKYVTRHSTLDVKEKIDITFRDFDKNTIKKIMNEIGTNWETNVTNNVGKLANSLINVFKEKAEIGEESEDRQRILKIYLKDMENLQMEVLPYNEFYNNLKSFYKRNEDLPMPKDSEDIFKAVEEEVKNLTMEADNEEIKTVVTRTYQWGRNFKETREYVANSAPSTRSFINGAVHWIKVQLGQLLPQNSPLPLSASRMEALEIGAHNFPHTLKPLVGHFDSFNPTILLLDLIVRKFTKSKPQRWHEDSVVGGLEAQAYALNIVEECEATLDGDDHQVDFPALQKNMFEAILYSDDKQAVRLIRDEVLENMNQFYGLS